MDTLINFLIIIFCLWFSFGGGHKQIQEQGFKSVVESVWVGQRVSK